MCRHTNVVRRHVSSYMCGTVPCVTVHVWCGAMCHHTRCGAEHMSSCVVIHVWCGAMCYHTWVVRCHVSSYRCGAMCHHAGRGEVPCVTLHVWCGAMCHHSRVVRCHVSLYMWYGARCDHTCVEQCHVWSYKCGAVPGVTIHEWTGPYQVHCGHVFIKCDVSYMASVKQAHPWSVSASSCLSLSPSTAHAIPCAIESNTRQRLGELLNR